ncbi:MAG: UDP-N-acetylmuramoyl-tripeptide--D-alanyl-D-alanine ligase [Proteobacteria bacterium]|nr:MAG: UDP-N-acetylmuramoyl-tripeptide--D-alanyl-D-alanine ligase [Pseudomonadota bacterium]
MKPLSPTALAVAAGGRLVHPGRAGLTVDAVFSDTRRPIPGGLFVALSGPTFDAHRFLAAAADAGAAAVLVSRPEAAAGLPDHVAVIAVEETLAGLQRLAASVRATHPGRAIAITGSVGKTTIKDMAAAALGASGPVHRTPGNWNNHIGLPLTLCAATGDEAFLVLELGMSAPGEIDALTRLADPDVGLVAGAAAAHLASFPSVDAIADAKAELLEALTAAAVAVANADDARILARARAARPDALTYGRRADADVRLTDVRLDAAGLAATVDVAGAPVDVRVAALGAHNAHNAAAALAITHALGLDPAAAAAALGQGFRPAPHRLTVLPADRGLTVLDDSYNANPASTRAALETLAAVAPGASKGAVLGSMLELGPRAPALHREVGAAAARAGLSWLGAAGPHAADLADGARAAGLTAVATADDALELADDARAFAADGRWLLLKGSRGGRLERLLAAVGAKERA